MRWAKSYSIVDHELLHGGYFQRLSHEAMVLYLFLLVVGDRNGKSFYGDGTIMDILRLDYRHFDNARLELIEEGLIGYRRPYWWVKDIVPSVRKEEITAADRAFAKENLKNISEMLSRKR